MMAALTAAGDRENRVVLLERQTRPGRKLMATGNGRCNLTNLTASSRNYHGEDADFVRFALSQFPPTAALDFFKSIGLLTVAEEGGRVYTHGEKETLRRAKALKDGVELDDATYSMLEGFASELGLGTLPATGCEKTDI